MLKNLMEDKRLDFDAPLLSVRRFSAAGGAASSSSSSTPSTSKSEESITASEKPATVRSFLPFYKSDLKSGPVRNPGVIPFLWEQTPGQPKDGPGSAAGRTRPIDRPPVAPKLPPGRLLNDREPIGTSVRTHRPISASSDGGTPRSLESSNGGENKSMEVEKEEKQQPSAEDSCNEEDDAFSDALDTLSRTESFFMNCSVSGLSGIPDAGEPSGSFSTDPQVRDFMMGRFLPAAQAIATSSPQCASRKPIRLVERAENGDNRPQRLPLLNQNRPNFVPQYVRKLEEGEICDDEDDEEDYYDDGQLSSKACGLLPRFCQKGAFCLLNPVPGMKVRGGLPPPSPGRRIGSPQIKASHHGSFGQAKEEHSWEAVYKHKLRHGNWQQAEDRSKIMSETNHLTNWSDSQTLDGSSPFRRSICGRISPYRNEPPLSPFHEGKGFLGVPRRKKKGCRTDGSDSCEKDAEKYWVITPNHGNRHGLCSMSPAIERTLDVDSVDVPETPYSKSSSGDTSLDIKGIIRYGDEDSEVELQSRSAEENLVPETCETDALQPSGSDVVESGSSFCSEISPCVEVVAKNGYKQYDGIDGPIPLKAEDQLKNDSNPLQSLLPPPLPKSPSESWLGRTLPSVTLKNPYAQSFLGIQFPPRKQPVRPSSTNMKQEMTVKYPKPHRQIRFADVLAKPLSLESEI